MNTPNDGGPAFPRDHRHEGHNGMSLRDWFAGQETLGELDHPDATVGPSICAALAGGSAPSKSDDPLAFLRWEAKWRAAWRYLRADAMLEARKGGAS